MAEMLDPGGDGISAGRHRPAPLTVALLLMTLWAVLDVPASAGGGVALPATIILGWFLLALADCDLRTGLLPDRLTLPLLLLGLAATVLLDPARLADHLLGAALGFGIPAGLAALYRRLRGRDGLGLGDAKLLAALGAWLGWVALPGLLLLAALAGILTVLLLRLAGRQPDWQAPIPFGPFLAGAGWLSWLYGPLALG